VLNIRLDEVAWKQASLPVRWGGIGVRKASVIAPSAFLASVLSSAPLVAVLLPGGRHLHSDRFFLEAAACWSTLAGSAFTPGQTAISQRVLDDGISSAISRDLLLQAGPVNRARLLASLAIGSGAWLQALPCNNLGLRLGNNELRIAVGLRLGTPLVRPHKCVYGSEVEPNGHHGLACRRSAGRHRRHTLANEVLVRAIRSVEVHAELEPLRLFRDDGKRPDGATLDPWSGGRYLVWDFTCPDTLAPSHLRQSCQSAGSAATLAESLKLTKYSEIASSGEYIFAPLAVETLGVWGGSATALCEEIGRRAAQLSGDSRSTTFLKQRLSLAVQRGNAASVAGTHPQGDINDLSI